MTDVCGHVPLHADGALAVLPAPEAPGYLQVRCPCCGLRAWRKPDDDLADDLCPYCNVQSEWVT